MHCGDVKRKTLNILSKELQAEELRTAKLGDRTGVEGDDNNFDKEGRANDTKLSIDNAHIRSGSAWRPNTISGSSMTGDLSSIGLSGAFEAASDVDGRMTTDEDTDDIPHTVIIRKPSSPPRVTTLDQTTPQRKTHSPNDASYAESLDPKQPVRHARAVTKLTPLIYSIIRFCLVLLPDHPPSVEEIEHLQYLKICV